MDVTLHRIQFRFLWMAASFSCSLATGSGQFPCTDDAEFGTETSPPRWLPRLAKATRSATNEFFPVNFTRVQISPLLVQLWCCFNSTLWVCLVPSVYLFKPTTQGPITLPPSRKIISSGKGRNSSDIKPAKCWWLESNSQRRGLQLFTKPLRPFLVGILEWQHRGGSFCHLAFCTDLTSPCWWQWNLDDSRWSTAAGWFGFLFGTSWLYHGLIVAKRESGLLFEHLLQGTLVWLGIHCQAGIWRSLFLKVSCGFVIWVFKIALCKGRSGQPKLRWKLSAGIHSGNLWTN